MAEGRIRIFIDASVLFAASDSATGASREIVRYALRGQVGLVVNRLVLEETERNLALKRLKALALFRTLQDLIPFEVVDPTRDEILAMKAHTELKDAPHFATARKAAVYCMVSLDRKHMVDVRQEILESLGIRILLPEEILIELREHDPS